VKVLLVDDEAPARSELRHLLGAHPQVEVMGEATSAAEALGLAGECDALFLDVEMPGASGIDAARLVRGRTEPPAIVFVTAHASYAVDAFAVEAFDYLLKPIDPERLARVVERLLARAAPEARTARKIPVVAGSRTELIDQDEVQFIQAEGDYSRVHVHDRSYLATASLRELEEALPGDRFMRIHRSTIVNLAKVAAVRRVGDDRISLALDDAQRTELDVARRQSRRVRDALKLG
jgi:two-component system, LytTR family, response regulator LytT